MNTYGLELERDANGWEMYWPAAQTNAYGIEAVLHEGSGEPTQGDYDLAIRTWVIAHAAGLLPQPLGALSINDFIRQRMVQNAPSSEALQ